VRRSRGEGASPERGAQRAPLSARHPKRVLAVCAVIVAFLAVLGFGVQDKLSPTSLDIGGTPSFKANNLLKEHFGDTALFAVLLQGPKQEIDRQGPEVVRALHRLNPRITTLSPWDSGQVGQLRPGPRRALILTDFHVPIADAVEHSVEELNGLLEREVQPPVRVTQSGFPTLSRALQEESIHASERGELIALPILLIVLLLVFRSPVAAGIPLTFGAITVFTSSGVLSVVTKWFDVDAFALTVCTMMGLALGVDYALLMVSRFREELAGGAEPLAAAATTRRAAGRTVIFAGSTLFVSMLVAFFVVPGALLASLAATVMLVVVISVSVAVIAGPAVLVLLGHNVNRWRIGSPPAEDSSSRLMILVGGALRRPVFVCLVVGAVVLFLASPAIGLKTGPPSAEQLPYNNAQREDAELINETITPGFDAPFIMVASTDRGAITDPKTLAALSRWQDKVAERPGVQVVIGPEQVRKNVEPLREQGNSLLAKKGGPAEELGRLGRNLGRAAEGVQELRGGIAEASDGAGLLAEGSDGAEEGALKIASGLARATSGSERAVGALGKFADGAGKLADGEQELTKGIKKAAEGSEIIRQRVSNIQFNMKTGQRISSKLQKSLDKRAGEEVPAIQGSAGTASEQSASAVQQLEGMTVGKSDPNYAAALDAARQAAAAASGAAGQLESLQKGLSSNVDEARESKFWFETGRTEMGKVEKNLEELHDGLVRLQKGAERLTTGAEKLEDGANKLSNASVGLEEGLQRLGTGAVRLAGGIAELGEGATSLETGLGEAFHESYPLQTGLHRATARVTDNAHQVRGQTDELREESPGIFDSGYFVLSALDGAPHPKRKRGGEVVDLNGGEATTTTIFTKCTFNSDCSIKLDKELEEEAEGLAASTGLNTGIAGGAATLNDYSRVTRERLPIVITAITLATFLIMVLVLRALPLAAIAVGLNLATVAVAFGVLTLLFNVPEGWPFGGQSYIDIVGGTMIFGVVFGLSIDYAVFLLIRMREHHELHGDNAAAIRFGLEKTARVITGAAIIMMAVFIAFAIAPIANVSQLGIGLTVAVLLDATVVRIVFLPSLMLLLGNRVWYLPRWLDRAIPKLDV
jgi:RND superfamily putative drug exporter